MTSGADLFVVCKQCGSEVSPYITECPYCGHRLRRRAPKLPRAGAPSRSPRTRSRLRRLLSPPKLRGRRGLRAGRTGFGGRSFGTRPYATIALVAASAGVWIAWHAQPSLDLKLAIFGPLHGEWWKLLAHQFAYGSGIYAFTTLVAVAIFGWLLEQRYGPVLVLTLFLGAGVAGALVASAVYPVPLVSGGGAGGVARPAPLAGAALGLGPPRLLLRRRPARRGSGRPPAAGDAVRDRAARARGLSPHRPWDELARRGHRRGRGPGPPPGPLPHARDGALGTYDGRPMTMTNAVVLIEAERDAFSSLGGTLADIDGVAEVYSVTGEWDFVAIVRVSDHEQLADVVTGQIGSVSGVLRTQTMVAFAAYSRHDLEALFSVGE